MHVCHCNPVTVTGVRTHDGPSGTYFALYLYIIYIFAVTINEMRNVLVLYNIASFIIIIFLEPLFRDCSETFVYRPINRLEIYH